MENCSNCHRLQQEIELLKQEIGHLKQENLNAEKELPPSYSISIKNLDPTDLSNSRDLFDLSDPSNVSSITLVHGYDEQFGQKNPIQFKLYDFNASRDSGSTFTGKGFDPEKKGFSIRGVWHNSVNCTINFRYKDISMEYKCVVAWKESVISGTYSIPPWSISGGDPFRYTFFSI